MKDRTEFQIFLCTAGLRRVLVGSRRVRYIDIYIIMVIVTYYHNYATVNR